MVDLCLSMFPWTKFRRAKGALKVHVGMDHEGRLPTFVTVTEGRTPDIEVARTLRLPKGSIVAADRSYLDFEWINSLILQGVFLVTRLKKGIRYRVVERRGANRRQGVTSDQTIEFTSARGRRRCPRRLRRIGCRDLATGKHCVLLTTNFQLSAKTIADIYKSRWQVELFFNLNPWPGDDAVMTQLWIAMCMYLLVSHLKFASRLGWSRAEIQRLLQLNLCERRPLSATSSATRRTTRRPASPQTEMKFAWS